MYGIEHKVLAIIYSLMMLAIAGGVRRVAGTLLIPAGIFALAWFAFTLVPLVTLLRVPINSFAVLYILGAVSVFSLSMLPFSWRSALLRNQSKNSESAKFDSLFLQLVLYFSVVASLSLSVVSMLMNGFTIGQVLFDLIRTSGQYAAVRGTEGVEYGIVGITSMMFTYLSAILGGLRAQAPNRTGFFLVSMLPSLVTMVTQSSKLVFLVGLCFYVSASLISKIYARQMTLPDVSRLLRAAVLAAMLFMFVLVSFVSRLGEFDPENLEVIADPLLFSIVSYTFGQIYAFGDFFSYVIGHPSAVNFKNEFYSYGAFTFASIFDTLGLGKEFPPGMYDESVWSGDVFETNIFTFFRGLIYDFGIAGSLLFVFGFGVVSNAVMYRVLARPRAWASVAMLIAIVVFVLMGYLFSVFVARYVFLVTLVTWLLLAVNERLYQPGKRRTSYRRNCQEDSESRRGFE